MFSERKAEPTRNTSLRGWVSRGAHLGKTDDGCWEERWAEGGGWRTLQCKVQAAFLWLPIHRHTRGTGRWEFLGGGTSKWKKGQPKHKERRSLFSWECMRVALPSEQADLLSLSKLQQERGERAKIRRKIRKDPDKAGEVTKISEHLEVGWRTMSNGANPCSKCPPFSQKSWCSGSPHALTLPGNSGNPHPTVGQVNTYWNFVRQG